MTIASYKKEDLPDSSSCRTRHQEKDSGRDLHKKEHASTARELDVGAGHTGIDSAKAVLQ